MQLQSLGPSFGSSVVDGGEPFLNKVMQNGMTRFVLGSVITCLVLQHVDKIGRSFPNQESIRHAFHVVGDAITKVAAPIGHALHSTYQAVSDVAQSLVTCDPIVVGQSFAAHPATGFALGLVVGCAAAAAMTYGFCAIKKALTNATPRKKIMAFALPTLGAALAATLWFAPVQNLFHKSPAPVAPSVEVTATTAAPLPLLAPVNQCAVGYADPALPHVAVAATPAPTTTKLQGRVKLTPTATKIYLGLPAKYNRLIPPEAASTFSQKLLRQAHRSGNNSLEKIAFYVGAYNEVKGKGAAAIKENLLIEATSLAYSKNHFYLPEGKQPNKTILDLILTRIQAEQAMFKARGDAKHLETAMNFGAMHATMTRNNGQARLPKVVASLFATCQKNAPELYDRALAKAPEIVGNPAVSAPTTPLKDNGKRYYDPRAAYPILTITNP